MSSVGDSLPEEPNELVRTLFLASESNELVRPLLAVSTIDGDLDLALLVPSTIRTLTFGCPKDTPPFLLPFVLVLTLTLLLVEDGLQSDGIWGFHVPRLKVGFIMGLMTLYSPGPGPSSSLDGNLLSVILLLYFTTPLLAQTVVVLYDPGPTSGLVEEVEPEYAYAIV